MNIKLDAYHEFMNEHVLKPIGVDYRDLLERGLAIEAPKGMYGKGAEK